MEAAGHYHFRKATLADLGLLMDWQARPHVRAWWGTDAPFDPEKLADPRVARWIVSCTETLPERPFAYLQDYSVHGWDNHHFANLPDGSRGMDQYIGDPAMIDKGHGSALLRTRMQALFENGAPVLATDPHPDNIRAIAVYTKLGFVTSGPPIQTQWGMILPMLAYRPRINRASPITPPDASAPPG